MAKPRRASAALKTCPSAAFASVPAFLGGFCPLGCSLSAPATGGFSVVSPQYRGTRCTPGGGCAPCTLLWGWGRFLTFPRAPGQEEMSFSRRQSHSLIVCVPALIVCVTAFSSPPALRRRGAVTKALQAITKPLRVVTQPLGNRYQLLPDVTSRYCVGWLQRACALQRRSLRSPTFLGGCCPLGCSLSAPAVGECSVVSAVQMYAAGSEEEKRAGCPLHVSTIAHPFVFCKGVLAGPSDSGVRPLMETGGLAWRALLSHRPTLQRFWKQGDTLYPRRGLRPLHPAWGTESGTLPNLPPRAGVGMGGGSLWWRMPLSHLAHQT